MIARRSSVEKIAIGTVQFGLSYGIANEQGQVTEPEGQRILSRAHEQGIELVDTAIDYGESEVTLGKIGVERFQIVTKLPPVRGNALDVAAWLDEQVADSLSRLRLSSLYGLLLHRSENLKGELGQNLVEGLQRLKSRGIVQKIGVSIYDPSELDYVTQANAVDLVQAPLNLVDRRLEVSGWLSRLKQMGVEVHTRSAFLQGLLLMPRDKIPARFDRWSHLWNAWAHGREELGVSPVAACLGYPLYHPDVDRVVVGVDSLSQLTELIKEASREPIPENWDFMAMEDERLLNPSRWSEL